MEYTDLPQEEITRYSTLNSEELRAIINIGVQTEFWKWLRVKLALTCKTADTHLHRRRLGSLDDLISLGMWNDIFKTSEEIFNAPEHAIKAIEIQKQLDKQKLERNTRS